MKLMNFFLTYEYHNEYTRSYFDYLFNDTAITDEMFPYMESQMQEAKTTIMSDQDLKEQGMYHEGGQKKRDEPAPEGVYYKADFSIKADLKDMVEDLQGSVGGSNGWIISGKYTESGKPLLSSDPHLANQLPSTWYLNELSFADTNSIGASLPGMPYVAIGMTKDGAWGITNSKADVADLFYITIEGEKYKHDGKWKDLKKREEIIKVKGKADKPLTVYSTHHGPVFRGIDPSVINKIQAFMLPGPLENIAFQWTAYEEKDNALEKLRGIKSVKTGQQFLDLFKDYQGPSYCLLAGFTNGDIAFIMPGLFPKRQYSRSGGLNIKMGDRADNDWKGYLEWESIPKILNPSKGYIVSANNRVTTENVKENAALSMSTTTRADRIEEMILERIKSGKKFTVEFMREM